MTNPFAPAFELWLAIIDNLPAPVSLLIDLSLGMFAMMVFFHIISKIRGG